MCMRGCKFENNRRKCRLKNYDKVVENFMIIPCVLTVRELADEVKFILEEQPFLIKEILEWNENYEEML